LFTREARAYSLFFWRGFFPGYGQFSNIDPLGVYLAEWMQLPSGLLGRWDDLNSRGFNGGSIGCWE
jgi:hypothetical protein